MNKLTDEVLAGLPMDIPLQTLMQAPFSISISNAALDDNPLVYVNKSFEDISGYKREDIVGQNCRFLQGKETDPKAVRKIREAIKARGTTVVELMNYRADGEKFLNRVMITPLGERTKGSEYFLGVQVDLGAANKEALDAFNTHARAMSEMQHRVKNHLSMIVSMIRMQARNRSANDDFDTLARRIETLQMLYEEMNERPEDSEQQDNEVDLGAYVARVGNAIAHLDGRHGVRVNVEAAALNVPFQTASRIGLAASEIVTNAMQHAFEGREQGSVTLRIDKLTDQDIIRLQIIDDGIGIPDGLDWPREGSLGSRIVRQLVDALDAEMTVVREQVGTSVTIDIPLPSDTA